MKKLLIIVLLQIIFSNSMFAQKIVPLWQENEIPNYQASDEKEVEREGDIQFIMKVQEPTLELFLPSKPNANGMAVLICPGGGYGGVAYDWEGTDYAKWFNSLGIAAFVLKYRMPQAKSVITSYKAPIQDAQRAIRYIRFHASEFNIEKSRVGVIGSSAGGHLASTLGTQFNENFYESKDLIDNEMLRPDFMMLIYPVISMKKGVTHAGSRNSLLGKNASDELVQKFSNELQVTEETPPAFIIHSADDKAVPIENSILMYKAMVKNNVQATMHLFPTGGHGYSLGKSRKNAPDWSDLAAGWLISIQN